tara:strand:- start:2700 stop:3332 length:633 start_codon:yes stop_codon:yes gene_type:complete
MSFYAVANGKQPGIYNTWKECCEMVKGFKNAIYKKFSNIEDAENFIEKSSENENENIDYYVYTDGACKNNGIENSQSGIGVYFGENDERNLSEKVEGNKQTNNVAELLAINKAFYIIENDLKQNKRIEIYSDSIYAVNSVRVYGSAFEIIKWKTDIPNKELIKNTYDLYKEYIGKNVFLKYIKAHTNKRDIHSIGNYNADRLANSAINLL